MGIKHRVNEQFFDTWSEEMAYVLGYMFADGNLMHSPAIRAKYVRFCSTDKDRIELIRDLMGSEHIFNITKRSPAHKEMYSLQFGSHMLFDALVTYGVTPKKSHTCLLPAIPDAYFAAFTLGYFDGDGCSFIERSKSGNARKLHCIFTSGSRAFLESLHARLVHAVRVQGKGICAHGSTSNAYQLRYATRDSMRVFQLMYGSERLRSLALQRKYAIFMKYFEERGVGPEDFASILTKKGPVAK